MMLEERLQKTCPQVKLATAVGRFYALDRDEQWSRTRFAYELLTEGKGEKIASISEYLKKSYDEGLTDEFIKPAIVQGSGTIRDNDALIFSDFREDSMRQITRAFADGSFDRFPRKKLSNLLIVTMTEYQKGLETLVAFPPLEIEAPLSRVLGEAKLRHLHIAETQKYAHVTYFFNGGKEKPFSGEERILIHSISTAHSDEVPEMRAPEITVKILENFDKYDVLIANFANADMVGHSGNFQAAVKAVEILDDSLGQIMNVVLSEGGVLMITSDHGNIELKRNALTGEKRTEHSINPVPFYLVGGQFKRSTPRGEEEIINTKKEVGGILTDVAPTILEILGIEQPEEMTGKSLLATLVQK